METSNSRLLEQILKTADTIKINTGNRYLSKEIVLLAYFVRIEQAAKEKASDEELEEVISIIENSFTDPQTAASSLQNQIRQEPATAENSQDWYNALHNMQAISQQIRAVRFDAGILLKVLLADPPACIRPFLAAEDKAADIKADSMFVRSEKDLTHAPEFRDFLNEVRGIAPLLKQTETESTLTNQVILISAEDDEYAIQTYLHMINDLYKETGLVDYQNPPGIVPISAATLMNGAFSAISQFTLDKIDSMVLCLDITEWIGSMDSPDFSEFLMKCYRRQGDFVFVFRVPYLEQAVLQTVADQLQDLFSLRVISFEPWSLDYMSDLAVRYIQEAGFDPDEGAMEIFRLRINEERSDGRFYGYATIRKVADEMIYLKQKSLIESGKVTLTINAKEVEKLSISRLAAADSGYLEAKMIGKEKVRARLNEIFEKICEDPKGMKHMYFAGEAGTGKTLAAKFVSKRLKEMGVIEKGRYFEYGIDEFIAMYDGATMPRAMSLLRDAYGSVIVINDLSGSDPFEEQEQRAPGFGSDEVISYDELISDAFNAIISQMKYREKDLVVIFAGTEEEIRDMERKFPELKELVPYRVEFERFKKEHLTEIFMKLIDENDLSAGEELENTVKQYFEEMPERMLAGKDFTSGRYINNLFEHTASKAAVRWQMDCGGHGVLLPCDFTLAANDSSDCLNKKKKGNHTIGFETS